MASDQGLRFGQDTYRLGALERIGEADILRNRKRFALAMYACGLAVEGMLRSLCCLKSREFDEKHDLRKFAVRVQNLGLLRPGRDDDFVSTVQGVAKYWRNTLRYADQKQLLRFLRAIGERLSKEDALNGFCERYYNQCAEVTKRCAALLARSRKLN